MTQELIESKEFAVAAYKPFYAQLEELEKNNQAIAFDYESAKGNKEARSHVYKLRQSKAALEKTRKEEKAESLRIGRAVDSEAKEIDARIEAMILVHTVKLDEIEKRETDRIDAIKLRLSALTEIHMDKTAADYRFHLTTLQAVKINDSWQEFAVEAAKAKDESIAKHSELLAAREKLDAEAAELEALRQAASEREQKDREEKIAREAAAKAVADAEVKAKAEREAAERRELQLKLDAENAERRRLEAEQKAKQDAIDAAAKAERDRIEAIENERKRVADAEAKAAKEQAEREADTKHKGVINRAALAAMVENGISEECAKQCIKLIACGKIPSISIQY